MNKLHCEKISELISGYIDNELLQQQRQLVSTHLESCEHCNKIYCELKELQGNIASLNYPDLEQETIKKLLQEPVSKGLAIAGWGFLFFGTLGLFIWHIFVLWSDSNVPVLLKFFITLIEIGLLTLLASVFRQRLLASKSDPYKDIQL